MDEKEIKDMEATPSGEHLISETIKEESVSDENELFISEDELEDFDIQESLQQQMKDDFFSDTAVENNKSDKVSKRMLRNKLIKTIGISFAVLVVILGLLIGTRGGRSLLIRLASRIAVGYMNKETPENQNQNTEHLDGTNQVPVENEVISEETTPQESKPWVRQADYVLNYLIFGIEEIDHAKNTDTMMIASINTRDKSIKLTSLMRDSYVWIPGWKYQKLNAAYAKGGVSMLMETIEYNYKIPLEGYAYVNFDSFEDVVDYLGGVTIELGKAEAHYLNTTNYISNPIYRDVYPGVNVLNGNQALGYCRVRGVVTLGGFNNDYGRTVRQKRVLNALFEQVKSKNIFELLNIADDILGFINTNMSTDVVQKALENIIENRILTLDTFRLPVDGMFNDPYEYQGITYPLVLDWDANVKELYKFIYLDTEEEATAKLDALVPYPIQP